MKQVRYNHLNEYYKLKFGERVLKIPLDGGFTCPNRDGRKSTGGCIFCSNRGSGDRLSNKAIDEQVKDYFASFKAKKANKFIAYFQNYSNTYGSIERLKETYDKALIDSRIIGLDIATRADCINEEIVKLLADYKKEYFVQVELGLQTASEITRNNINQCILEEEFINAVSLLNKYDIEVVIHVMVGLPNETHKNIIETVTFLNKLNFKGLKIHSTFIEKDTGLYNLYLNGKYTPITYDEYIEELVYILTHINKNIIIHRITGDPYLPNFVEPKWMAHKKLVTNEIEKILEKRGLYQGIIYNE